MSTSVPLAPIVAAALESGKIDRPKAIALGRLPFPKQAALLQTAKTSTYAVLSAIIDSVK